MEVKQVTLSQEKINRRYFYRCVKRLFDFCASLIALIPLSVIFLLIAILIKLDDRGPIMFTQTRVGRNGKLFKIYKFRSMRVNAEDLLEKLKAHNQVEGPMFKMKDDPRITRVGKFLRKTSLDELPQLLNVVKGDMSLVGPRPPLPAEVEQYSDYDKQRLYVMPGCTGLWQATERNNTGFSGMVKLDLEYIQKASVWLDLKIILMTIKVIFVPNGAY
ncbi:sugar transferase [Ligilactobacillus equi]|uniref:Undecaprenyl-phosphate galactose phosphotransferase n=1 Tax=Ligilactobacillus equi DSM 15833 = JCM 10991 TaxID=1423740 RepID=A0A0R1TEL6_9LACO|nr:sugar transferase [Ligilactobacillus equi]KRL79709.1 Undecaprenyl-phosphate galactose phosphotransferase [Ligilactobacillus equi DSM 15833 = JCM 10991]